jgi:hypothetical protein
MTESNSGHPSCRGTVQRLKTEGEDLLKRFAQTDADNPPTLATFCAAISTRASILLQNLPTMTIELAAGELSEILESLDNAIERMSDRSADVLNTARYRRSMRRKTLKFWYLVNKLIVYAPNHYMAVSVKGASRGSGATVTLDGTELGSNGERPGTTKLTNTGGSHPAETCPQPPLKGGRRGAPGGSRNGGVSAFHSEYSSRRTESIYNVGHCESPFWRWVFPLLPRGAYDAAWSVSALLFYHEAYISSEAVPKPTLAAS